MARFLSTESSDYEGFVYDDEISDDMLPDGVDRAEICKDFKEELKRQELQQVGISEPNMEKILQKIFAEAGLDYVSWKATPSTYEAVARAGLNEASVINTQAAFEVARFISKTCQDLSIDDIINEVCREIQHADWSVQRGFESFGCGAKPDSVERYRDHLDMIAETFSDYRCRPE